MAESKYSLFRENSFTNYKMKKGRKTNCLLTIQHNSIIEDNISFLVISVKRKMMV